MALSKLAYRRQADLRRLQFIGQRHDAGTYVALFEVVSKRYEALKPMVLTSNKSYGTWNEIFPDPVLATALLDRLLHHSTTVNLKGDSYRLRNRTGTCLRTHKENHSTEKSVQN
jgi:hypothetical protein